MKTGKRIPISDAKEIALRRGYCQVIIHGFDNVTGNQHITTYGKSEADCINAAAGGNAIKKLLKWDESLYNAKPARQIKREKFKQMEEIINGLKNIIDKPSDDDIINLMRCVGLAVLAKKYGL